MSAEDKFEKLFGDLKSQLDEKRAQVTATQTQLNALQAVHKDTGEQVGKIQAELLKARDAKEAAQKEAKAILRDAEQTAARIRGEADRKVAAAFQDAEEILTNIQATVTEALTTVKRKRIN
jgi:cell division septum initiation protein DivIVA